MGSVSTRGLRASCSRKALPFWTKPSITRSVSTKSPMASIPVDIAREAIVVPAELQAELLENADGFDFHRAAAVPLLEIFYHPVDNIVGRLGQQARLDDLGPVLALPVQVCAGQVGQLLIGRQAAVGLGPPRPAFRARQRSVLRRTRPALFGVVIC